jgi:anti-anti-sigma factor
MLGTCEAVGNLDAETGPAFSAVLRDFIDNWDQSPFISVDCSGVTYMDPVGYRLLVEATRHAARRGHRLVVRDMSPSCARLLRLYEWDHELHFERSPQPGERLTPVVWLLADTHRSRSLSVDAP